MCAAYKFYCRIVDEAEAKQRPTTSSQRCNAVAHRTLFLSSSRSVSLARATPSFPRVHFNLPSVPSVNECVLESLDHSAIGDGRFGSCSRMAYKDLYVVCVKKMEKDAVSVQALKSEAAILCSLNGGGFTPHCFGICLNLHAIVMSYINVLDKSITLFSVLYENLQLTSFSPQQCSDVLVGLCSGVQYVHTSGFLHNDLKLDNVVLGNSLSGNLKPYIIDFGKACLITKGRTYSLSDAEISMYKKEHPQVAPDLRDGLVKQTISSDIFSLGRIMKRCNSVMIQSSELSPLIRQALSYHSRDRPSIEAILSLLAN